jgi:hypothetical protein
LGYTTKFCCDRVIIHGRRQFCSLSCLGVTGEVDDERKLARRFLHSLGLEDRFNRSNDQFLMNLGELAADCDLAARKDAADVGQRERDSVRSLEEDGRPPFRR